MKVYKIKYDAITILDSPYDNEHYVVASSMKAVLQFIEKFDNGEGDKLVKIEYVGEVYATIK